MKRKMNDSDSEDVELDLDTDDEDSYPKGPTLNELDKFSDEATDSETEALQEAFAKGLLKPGLNVPTKEKKQFVNNGAKLKEKLAEMFLDLPWIEKLDVFSKPASIAPELAKQLDEDNQDPIVRDDFKRESLFYRQAQAAVLEAVPRLHSLGVLTLRPEDYFAEMAKSDAHMQKVKSKLIQQKAVMERIEKVRQLRKQKKMQKAIQAENKLKKQNARKELANEVKKFRKGERKDLGFLEDKPAAPVKKKTTKKRQRRDNKFGFGGRKRGTKRNTQTSLDGANKKKGAKKVSKMNRPGKDRRKKIKNKKR